ncbi:Sua5/YciO/YrdC/YwlC family protein [Anabaena subtropica]|uniref:L-threonylcarbamoyladenylate synthase n=1 Tax=Anabaena subtropica FACHB-260 TaxID=2692884 RepID=A0ABR8CJT8_9NOST|nr:Sua5/YciO/YrdC/YwlC family protein [Anabaena subtropica]MBD2342708.1 Sua5/YciO/YrdC/YwlC family protein [Anabaena subtropica FACHB-260]
MISEAVNYKYWTNEEANQAFKTIKEGGLVIAKGDIGYGFFATSEAAIRKMYQLKNRPHSNPCIVIANLQTLPKFADIPHLEILQWIEKMVSWTTLAVVLPVKKDSEILNSLPPWVYSQSVTNGTVAAFLNTGSFLESLVQRADDEGFLFVGTSGNVSSQGNTYSFTDLPKEFTEQVDLVIDHGTAKYANDQKLATTIVNFTNWTIKRRGVNWETIEPSFYQLKEKLESIKA